MNRPFEKKLLYRNSEGMEVIEVLGVPKGATWVEVTNRTFRHYSDHAQEIAQTKILKSGLVPYIVIHPGVRREIYTEMTGAFVTDPGISPSKVGLGNHRYPYVDLRLKPDTPLLKVEDRIYFIPTPPTMPLDWIQLNP